VIPRGRSRFVACWRWLAVLAWAGFIWWLTSLPPEKVPELGFTHWEDKLVHAALFCVWGLLVCWAAPRGAGSLHGLSRIAVALLSVLAAAAYGVLTELHQAGIGRNADMLDVLADVAGAAVAPYLYFSSKLKNLLKRITPKRGGCMRHLGSQARSSPSKPDAERSLKPPEQPKPSGS